MYAILDIETTGGKFNQESITEIAIYKFDGQKVVDQFISLINPEKPIQDFVVKLTGINNQMLKNAPKFYEVAKRIIEITENCVLVAHNSQFDYRILKLEFNRLAYLFERNTLCTVELSKKLIPDQPSYSLGRLCKGLGIPLSDRHRANGDALATVQLFKLLLEKDSSKTIFEKTIKYTDRRNYKKKISTILEQLPEKEGVYYIHNESGTIIFIGRGKNIKQEANRLFLKTTKRALKIKDYMESISFEETGNQLITKLKYYTELDSINPRYNIIRKRNIQEKNFNNSDFIIVEQGRNPEEKAVILIEDFQVIGYGFTNLSFQFHQLEVLKSILTPIKNKDLAKAIIKNYLDKHSVYKIIRFKEENNY